MGRPDIFSIDSLEEYHKWYWDKDEMIQLCEVHGLSTHGNKAAIRARIVHFLQFPNQPYEEPSVRSAPTLFNWSKATLDFETTISSDITFGPNVRGFFKKEIGPSFKCHSDFMDWVRDNIGATLGEAIDGWKMLESRKADPSFRRKIAPDNMMNQYIREFFNAVPDGTFQEALECWGYKKYQPLVNGRVKFSLTDMENAATANR